MRRKRTSFVVVVLAAFAALGLGAFGLDAPHAAVPPDRTRPIVAADTQTVVLLHGLGRSHRSMRPLERFLEAAGYRVVNLGYPSRSHSVEELVETVAAELAACCGSTVTAPHFVTHSLGGILLRAYQAAHEPAGVGRVVMLSPPNHGSQVVDRIPDELLESVLGPAALQLGTGSSSVAHRLPPVDFELGIITGDRSFNPLFSWWLPGDDDGKVTVESARVDGAEDFLVVPYSHTWIMQRDQVMRQVLAFLGTGRFMEELAGGAADYSLR